MNYEFTYFYEFLFYVTVLKFSKQRTTRNNKLYVDDAGARLFLPYADYCGLALTLYIERISRQYIQIAIFYFSTRMLKSFFFRVPEIYILWACVYKLWLRDLLPLYTSELFHAP